MPEESNGESFIRAIIAAYERNPQMTIGFVHGLRSAIEEVERTGSTQSIRASLSLCTEFIPTVTELAEAIARTDVTR